MNLLIIGGTQFLGRHVAAQALERGWNLTLFTRGETNAELFPEAEHLRGDRNNDVSALEGKAFDVVVDTCGYHPRGVARTAAAVTTGLYCFVSTISVYADLSKPGVNESSPLAQLNVPLPDTYEPGELYGALKALCEREVDAARSLIVRPGLIVGPDDTSDRFTYWPARAARGGEILAPGRPERTVQIIDVRDLAAWMLAMIERGRTGTYNATGPASPLTMETMLHACADAAGTPSTIRWADEAWLLDRKVEPWTGLPVWLPQDGEYGGIMAADITRALAEGLTFRPVPDTARDTLAWDRTRPAGERKAGLDPERERELLRELSG